MSIIRHGESDIADPFDALEPFQNLMLKNRRITLLDRFPVDQQPGFDLAQTHVDLMRGGLQLEDGRFPPLGKEQCTCVKKTGQADAQQQNRNGSNQE